MAEAGTKTKRKRESLPVSEKKRRKYQRHVEYSKSRVYLGSEANRWTLLKEEKHFKRDREVATFLLDHYKSTHDKNVSDDQRPGPSGEGHLKMRFSSTPISAITAAIRTPSVSEVSELESEPQMSGVEEIKTSGEGSAETSPKKPFLSKRKLPVSKGKRPIPKRTTAAAATRKRISQKNLLDSLYVDPMNLTIEVSNADSDVESECDDPDYEPSMNITAILPDDVNAAAEDEAFEVIEFNVDENVEAEETDESDDDMGVGVDKVRMPEQCEEVVDAVTCLVYLKQILTLIDIKIGNCKTCSGSVHVKHYFVGSALYLKWVCDHEHVSYVWCSQPLLNRRLHSGDFMVCASVLTSGNNFSKMKLWANQLGLKYPSAGQFHRIQRTYLIPAVDQAWSQNQQEVIQSFQDRAVVLMGDGRNDNPGHCAQYCSYTLMEYETKKIVTLQTLDKRQTERKSAGMEKRGLEQALQDVENKGLRVTEVVTDGHIGITSLMMKQVYYLSDESECVGKRADGVVSLVFSITLIGMAMVGYRMAFGMAFGDLIMSGYH